MLKHVKAQLIMTKNLFGISKQRMILRYHVQHKNEINKKQAAIFSEKNGVKVVAEGANMPCTLEAVAVFLLNQL